MWAELDEPERALAAASRRYDTPWSFTLLNTDLLEQRALMADVLGRREDAARWYADYLEARPEPETPFIEGVRHARSRLEALSAEP